MSKTRRTIRDNRVSLIISSHLNDADMEFQMGNPELLKQARLRLKFVNLLLAKWNSNDLISLDEADETWRRVVANYGERM